MAVRIAINGFGRIGRQLAALATRDSRLELSLVNDPMPLESAEYLLTHDSARCIRSLDVQRAAGALMIEDSRVVFTHGTDAAELPLAENEVDVVVESSGLVRERNGLKGFLEAGAKRVVTCYPLAGEGDLTVLPGINEDEVGDEEIVSAGTCTAHGLAPVMKVLDDRFEVESGFFTTVHATTSDQPSVDSWHPRSLRKGRAAASNIVPVDTIAHYALEEAMPEMRGKLSGYSLRVPVLLVSLLELDVKLRKPAKKKELDILLREAASDRFQGIISVRDDQPVSSDLVASPYSAVIDSHLLAVRDNGMARVCFWYDNETGFCHRLAHMLSGSLAPRT